MPVTWEDVERYRDRTFRRRKSLRVRGPNSALRFINDVGFCTAFSRHDHLPCLWVAVCGARRPRMPVHTHSDYALGLTWDLKDRLPDERRVFYARLLHGKPSLVSLDYLPCFYRLFGPGEVGQGSLGATEQGVLDWLATHPPQPTHQLRLHGDYRGTLSKARFEKAVARLQEGFYAVKTKTVYEPKFTYFWGMFEKTFPREALRSRRISRQRALEKILKKYFAVALCARRRDVLSIFRGMDASELDEGLRALARDEALLTKVKIQGAAGDWYFLNCAMIGTP